MPDEAALQGRTDAAAVSGWVVGDHLGLPIPAHIAALGQGGADFLTLAMRASGALDVANRVTGITRFEECVGGSTGRKLFLSVSYDKPLPALPEALFVKFSRDFDDPIRDRGRDQLGPEVRLAALSRRPEFPIRVPACMFGDYHEESGTGVLITERIAFGADGVEPHHEKCLDHELPDALEHYRAVISANAALAGTHRAGALGADVDAIFPFDAGAAARSDPIRYDARQLRNRAARLAAFAEEFPRLLPPNIVAPSFIARLAEEMPLFLERQDDIRRFLTADPDLIALCHWNANLDNAWFWRDAEGRLQCGLMDWGRVGQMNAGLALWGTLSGAETEMLDAHLDDLLSLFLRDYADHGGPRVALARLRDHLFLYVANMGMSWLLDAPPLIRVRLPELAARHDRFDPIFKANETARTQLHMLTNFLNLWERHDFGQILKRVPAGEDVRPV